MQMAWARQCRCIMKNAFSVCAGIYSSALNDVEEMRCWYEKFFVWLQVKLRYEKQHVGRLDVGCQPVSLTFATSTILKEESYVRPNVPTNFCENSYTRVFCCKKTSG